MSDNSMLALLFMAMPVDVVTSVKFSIVKATGLEDAVRKKSSIYYITQRGFSCVRGVEPGGTVGNTIIVGSPKIHLVSTIVRD